MVSSERRERRLMMARKPTQGKTGKRRYFGQLFERPGRAGVYIKFRFGGSRYCRLAGLTWTDAENYALELGRKIKSGVFEI